MENINDSYFDGLYKEVWRNMIPGLLTEKEMEFMIPHFSLDSGKAVLDMMCGYGRHALVLARKGIRVTAVDNLPEYIEEIKETALRESLPLEAVQANLAHYRPAGQYDLAICMGNSLNFFGLADLRSILQKTAAALLPGGHLLIHSWSIAEIAYPRFKEEGEGMVGDMNMKTRAEILFRPARMIAWTEITGPDGHTETKQAIDYIYSLNEMEYWLQEAGLQLEEVYSIPGRKSFSIGEPRAYLIARKP